MNKVEIFALDHTEITQRPDESSPLFHQENVWFIDEIEQIMT